MRVLSNYKQERSGLHCGRTVRATDARAARCGMAEWPAAGQSVNQQQ